MTKYHLIGLALVMLPFGLACFIHKMTEAERTFQAIIRGENG